MQKPFAGALLHTSQARHLKAPELRHPAELALKLVGFKFNAEIVWGTFLSQPREAKGLGGGGVRDAPEGTVNHFSSWH